MKTFAGLALMAPLCFFAIQGSSQGQQSEEIKVDEKMSDYEFVNLINHPQKKARISDFRGKLLILDFWSTYCASCVASWPKLLHLQEKFNDDIQILLINIFQDENAIKKTIQSRKRIDHIDMTLPIAYGDTALYKLLPYEGVPHVVWIDKGGFVRSITSGIELQASNIEAVLKHRPVSMIQKLPPDLSSYLFRQSKIQDTRKPLLINGNGEAGNYIPLVTQSLLTGRIEGIESFQFTERTDSVNSIVTFANTPIDMMYKVAFNDRNFGPDKPYPGPSLWFLPHNRVIWDVRDTGFESTTESGEARLDRFYYYQLVTAPTSRKRLQEMVQADLKKYFGLNARMETRKVKCLVLTVADPQAMQYSGKATRPVVDQRSGRRIWNNLPLPLMVRDITYGEYLSSPYPIVDETGFDGIVGGIEIYGDPIAFDRELEKHGMRLTLQDREIEMLVVSEADDYVFPTDLEYKSGSNELPWTYGDALSK